MSRFLGDGPFRINAPTSSSTHYKVARDVVLSDDITPIPPPTPTPQPGKPGDDYLKRLVLLIPSEVLALYLTFKEVTKDWLGIWSVVCLLLVVFVRTVGTKQAGKPVQVPAVLVASISFVLWIYATGGLLLNFTLPATMPGLVSASVGVWTFLIPFFYKGD